MDGLHIPLIEDQVYMWGIAQLSIILCDFGLQIVGCIDWFESLSSFERLRETCRKILS